MVLFTAEILYTDPDPNAKVIRPGKADYFLGLNPSSGLKLKSKARNWVRERAGPVNLDFEDELIQIVRLTVSL